MFRKNSVFRLCDLASLVSLLGQLLAFKVAIEYRWAEGQYYDANWLDTRCRFRLVLFQALSGFHRHV